MIYRAWMRDFGVVVVESRKHRRTSKFTHGGWVWVLDMKEDAEHQVPLEVGGTWCSWWFILWWKPGTVS